MNVDLPTPGTPLMPTRRAPPACGSSSTSSSCACSRWSARRDSTSVMARAITRRSPASTPSTSAGTSTLEPSARFSGRGARTACCSRSCAASAMTVPGGKTAAAPISFSVGTSSGGMTPPTTISTSSAPSSASASRSAGTSVRWPAASDETPTTCTSASTACRATSSGVWNSGPTSTSKPRSANAVAMTFWPRSWPSWPILATRMRGRRPSASSNSSAIRRVSSNGRGAPCLVAVHTGDGADLAGVPPVDLLQRVGDLPDGRLRAGGVDGELEQVRVQVAAPPSLGGRAGGVGEPAQRVAAPRRRRARRAAARAWPSAGRARRRCRP